MADPWILAMWVAATSILAFSVCVFDKSRARRNGQRIRERTLLLLALAGGSPGLVLAMLVVRHKTRKTSFLVRVALVLVIQAIAAWLLWRSRIFSET